MKKLSEVYAPKPQAEKDFVALHKVKKTTDKSPATKDDKLFNASNIKSATKPGRSYKSGEDEKAYDNGKSTGVNDQRTVTSTAPYTVTEDENEIEEGWKKLKEDFSEEDIDNMIEILDTLLLGESTEVSETTARDFARGVNPNHPTTTIKNPQEHPAYNKDAVEKAIKSSRKKINKAEAERIHGLLKGWRK